MNFRPFSDTPDESVTLCCESVGRPGTSMWTEGRTYIGRVTGSGCGLIEVRDDLGYLRILPNTERPTFPMGTSGPIGFERVYTALFDRVTLPVYFMNDQPFQCPKCGTRTDFEERPPIQLHMCPRCKFHFVAEEDPDREHAD